MKVCRHCGKAFTKREIEMKKLQKSNRIKEARSLEDPETRVRYDRQLIVQLRSKGFSIRKIAEIIGCSTTPVQTALKEVKE